MIYRKCVHFSWNLLGKTERERPQNVRDMHVGGGYIEIDLTEMGPE